MEHSTASTASESKKPDATYCLIDNHHGIYIPQVFAERWPATLTQSQKDAIDLGPEDENGLYWEAWDEILEESTLTIDGYQFKLEMSDSGDVLAVCDRLMTVEEYFYFYEELPNGEDLECLQGYEMILVCGDCRQVIANHDYSGLDYHYSSEDAEKRKEDIDEGLERLGWMSMTSVSVIRTSPCECCGDRWHGDRYVALREVPTDE